MICDKCGNEVKIRVKYCTKCGTKINRIDSVRNRSGKKAKLVIGGCCISFILLIILAVTIAKHKDSRHNNTANDSSEIFEKQAVHNADMHQASGNNEICAISKEDVDFIFSRKLFLFKDTMPELYEQSLDGFEEMNAYKKDITINEILESNSFTWDEEKWEYLDKSDRGTAVTLYGEFIPGSMNIKLIFWWSMGAKAPLAMSMEIKEDDGTIVETIAPERFDFVTGEEQFLFADAAIAIMLSLMGAEETDIKNEYIAEVEKTLFGNDAIESAKNFFKDKVGIYTDLDSSGTIIIEEYLGSHYIAGSFSPIYDTNCIESNENMQYWVFESYGFYYKIVEGLDGYYIYYAESREELNESSRCCGIFSTSSVDSDLEEGGVEHCHIYGEWTNSEDGVTHLRMCSCGEYETEIHSFDEGKITEEPTIFAMGIKTYYCKECNTTKTETVPQIEHTHAYSSWLDNYDGSTHSRSCSCGAKETGEHTFDSGTITTEPTCSSTGVITYTCTVCGATQAESIPQIEIPNTMYYDKQRVCDNCGHDDGTKHYVLHRGEKIDASWTCSSCGTQNTSSIEMY